MCAKEISKTLFVDILLLFNCLIGDLHLLRHLQIEDLTLIKILNAVHPSIRIA